MKSTSDANEPKKKAVRKSQASNKSQNDYQKATNAKRTYVDMNTYKKKKKKKSKGAKIAIIAGSTVLGLLLLIVGIGLFYIASLYRSTYVPDEKFTLATDYTEEDPYAGMTKNEDGYYVIPGVDGLPGYTIDPGVEANSSQLAQIEDELNNIRDIPILNEGGVTNILLIGRDVRVDNWNGNSDAMILMSINASKNTIFLTSFMRDSYANIPGRSPNKLNYAHAIGGPQFLVQTIQENYRIAIDYYATINFDAFQSLVDVVDGVSMSVTDAEVKYMNQYMVEQNRLKGRPDSTDQLPGGGTYNLNGNQALAYCRVRYVGSDHARTERQRKVLVGIFGKMQTMSPFKAVEVANTLASYVKHNIPPGDFISLVTGLPKYLSFGIHAEKIPYDGLYNSMTVGKISGVLVPQFEATINRLHNTIYGK